MKINTQTKLTLGTFMSAVAALGIMLTFLLGWSQAPDPWGFVLGFMVGVFAGLEVTLSLARLIMGRHSNENG